MILLYKRPESWNRKLRAISVQGKDAVPFLEKLVVGDIAGIENGSGSLTVFTNEKGGIIDDSVVTKVPILSPKP